MFSAIQPQLSSVVAQAAAATGLFKPGQVLEALVVGKMPDGSMALKIGDVVIKAQLPQPMPPGTVLQLQVKTGGPSPQLLLVGTPQLPSTVILLQPTGVPLLPLAPVPTSPPRVGATVAQAMVLASGAITPSAVPAQGTASPPPAPSQSVPPTILPASVAAPPPTLASAPEQVATSATAAPAPAAPPPSSPHGQIILSRPPNAESMQAVAASGSKVALTPAIVRPATMSAPPAPVLTAASASTLTSSAPAPSVVAAVLAAGGPSPAPLPQSAAAQGAPPLAASPVPAAPAQAPAAPAPAITAAAVPSLTASVPVLSARAPAATAPAPSQSSPALPPAPAPMVISQAAAGATPIVSSAGSPPSPLSAAPVASPAITAGTGTAATAAQGATLVVPAAQTAGPAPPLPQSSASTPPAASMPSPPGQATPTASTTYAAGMPTVARVSTATDPAKSAVPANSAAPQAPRLPATPAAALAQMIPEAMARQNSIAPLLASLAAMAARPGALPEPVLRAALQVLGQRVQVAPSGPTAQHIQTAVAKSGIYLEAGLAKGAAPAADLKSGLVALKGALATFLGGNPAPVTAVQQVAPPLRGIPPRAEALDPPVLPDAPRDAARSLHSQTDAALSRVKLMQLASLPDADPARPVPQELRMEVPFLIGQQLVMAQFQVLRDGARAKSDGKRGWTMRFAMNLAAAGEVGAEVALLGQSVNVALWAADPETAAGLEAALPELAPALSALGLEPGAVRVRAQPPESPKPPAGRYLDSLR